MKKLLPAALLLTLLTGCGANHLAMAPTSAGGQFGALSKAGVDKGIHAMFKAAFKAADAKHDGKLTLDELPVSLPVPPIPGTTAQAAAALDQDQARKDLFMKLDLNKDGVVTYREFARPDAVQAAIVFYRSEIGKVFASLDKNGDHVLTTNETDGTVFQFANLDHNKNGKITLSEFEDVFVSVLGGGPEPVEPVAPPAVNPAPPVVNPAPVPAPAGDTPAPAPAPAGAPTLGLGG